MYGSDAITGVMSFHTLTPKLASGAKPLVSGATAARYSSANSELTGHADGKPYSPGWYTLKSKRSTT